MGIMIERDSEQSLQCILGTNVLDRMKGQQSETGMLRVAGSRNVLVSTESETIVNVTGPRFEPTAELVIEPTKHCLPGNVSVKPMLTNMPFKVTILNNTKTDVWLKPRTMVAKVSRAVVQHPEYIIQDSTEDGVHICRVNRVSASASSSQPLPEGLGLSSLA